MIHFNNNLSLHLDLQRSHSPFRLSDNEFPMHAVCSTNFIFLDSFFQMVIFMQLLQPNARAYCSVFLTSTNSSQPVLGTPAVHLLLHHPMSLNIEDRFTHSMPCSCRAHVVPLPRRTVNSHIPCRAPALLRQCRVLRESPRGSRKYPNC
jgi:hypothetical protein